MSLVNLLTVNHNYFSLADLYTVSIIWL